jgi:redox-sensitive bicupin YhaK (pirin superfamily)
LTATVLAGEALGLTSPAEVHTPLMSVDLHADSARSANAVATLPLRADFEHAVLSLEGDVRVNGQPLPVEELLYLPLGTPSVAIEAAPGSRLLVIGGEPMDEAILLWWNFVARTGEEIAEARAQWEAETRQPATAARRFGPPLASPLAPLHAPSLDGVVLRASR